MSHFVSGRASHDFESFQNQLLRRQPVDEATQEAEEQVDSEIGEDSHNQISASLASRRKRDGIEALSQDDQKGQATPSLYSRRNSPELSEAGPSRPRSVAGSSSDVRAQIGSQDYFNKPARSASHSYQVDLKNGRVQGDPFSTPASHNASSAYPDAALPIPLDSENPHSSGSSSPASSIRPRRLNKGVSFSHPPSGPGEEGHGSKGRRHPARSNSGFQEPLPGGHFPRTKSLGMISPAEMAPRKLGTWDGVFMPVSLNILGIILFLRFGFILGQAGLLGALFLLFVSYAIDTLTAMSLNAISTNGQVRGGGAYYLISRSLGPEFGGSIGLIFFAGQALNAAMNVLGFVETLTDAFGESRGASGFLPEGPWYFFFYGSVILLLSAVVCLVGSKLFARATLALALVLGVSIISIPISSLTVKPFIDDDRGAYYTGWAWDTLRGNLFPNFTSGAVGSSTGAEAENWQSVFGVLFPAVTGILAGASMSGDLRKPSKSIPKGTNWSLVFTFLVYFLSFIVFAGTIERESFYIDVGIVSDVALSPQVITFGALASTAFSALMGVMACGKVLQAIARDNLLPVLDVFGQGTQVSDTPIYAVIVTYVFCQMILFVDSVNTIAQLVTMTTLLTFGTLCFATCALKAGGAPSFRPSFKYWNIWTAAGGAISCFGAMFFTNPAAAFACIVFAVLLFVMIHFFSPPKPWGDVTRNITYHFVRKYLLRLDERKGHVKYWRPQILLLANNPRSEWNLIIFCNSLKKGALYVLGHVLKGEFTECLHELRKQQVAWLKLVDLTNIKSFVDVVIAQDEREGARNLILSCGLGGMRPNIVVMGYPSDMRNTAKVAREHVSSGSSSGHRSSDGSEITIRGLAWPHRQHRSIDIGSLPTDVARKETPIKPTTYVGIMEDSLALNKALAIAYGFDLMQMPTSDLPSTPFDKLKEKQERYIDLWPIQITSAGADESHAWDTYTMVLQLGTILSFTGTWKAHKLRVSVFVEHSSEVEEERRRIRALLDNLRIPASLRVFCLADESVLTYQTIVHGRNVAVGEVDDALRGDPWWEALKQLRRDDERRTKAAAKRQSVASPVQPIPASLVAPDANRKQSKREQKLFGISLPAEHLAFHKQNIRLGLAHPRARRIDVDDGDSSDEDDEEDYEDELALLSEDDTWFMDSARQNKRTFAKRRASTADDPYKKPNGSSRQRSFSITGSSSMPDELRVETERPLLSSSASSTNTAGYGSLSSSQRTATPDTVRAAARKQGSASQLGTSYLSNDSNATPKASLHPQDMQPSPLRKTLNSEDPSRNDDNDELTLKASDRKRLQRQAQDSAKEGPLPTAFLRPPMDQRSTSRASSATRNSVLSDDASEGTGSGGSSCGDDESKGQSFATPTQKRYRQTSSGSAHSRTRSEETWSAADTTPQRRIRPGRTQSRMSSGKVASIYSTDLPVVSFNELPNKAQYLILNELIRTNSSAATGVVLTALPAPEPGTSLDELKSLRYLEQLESLFAGGPPVLGVHAKTLTMTMSL